MNMNCIRIFLTQHSMLNYAKSSILHDGINRIVY